MTASRPALRRLLHGLLVSICFAIMVNFVSSALHGRWEHHNESMGKEQAVLVGAPYVLDGRLEYWPEFQGRVLFAVALGAVTKVGVPVNVGYQMLRVLTAVLAFLAVWYLVTGVAGGDEKTAAMAMAALAYTLALQMNHPWEHPSDFLDPLFFTLFVQALLTRRRLLFVLLVAVSSFSRESSVFAGVMWFAVYGVDFARRRLHPREMAFGFVMSVLAYCAVLAVRYMFGGDKALHVKQHTSFYALPGIFRHAFLHPTAVGWPVLLVAMYLLPALWLAANREAIGWKDVQLLLSAGAIFLISNVFSFINELRMLMPATTIVVLVAAIVEARVSGRTRADSGVPDDFAAANGRNAPHRALERPAVPEVRAG